MLPGLKGLTHHDKFDGMACGERKPSPESESPVIALLEFVDEISIAKV
jgi:hypothetical protein